MADVPPVIDVRGLVKRFGEVTALDGFDMRVDMGEVRGLVGPNGAGKTTLLRIMFGLVAPDSGSMRLLGRDWNTLGSGTIPGVAGFVEDPRFQPYLSAQRNLELLARMDGVDRDRVDEVLRAVGLDERGGHKVGGFSSGMRQRLGLAASLLRSPTLLLLDEPTVGLDPTGAREVQLLLRGLAAEGITVLLSSHNMVELDGLCDSVTVMRKGTSVWEGSMERLRAEAPAPAHRMWTSADGRALDVARTEPEISAVPDPGGWLIVSGEPPAIDGYVYALSRARVAVRRLEPLMTALESMFFELVGAEADSAADRSAIDGVGAVR